MNRTHLTEDLTPTRQSVVYTAIAEERGQRFRVLIKRDSYEFQSHATVEVWTPEGWSLVHRILGEDPRVSSLPGVYALAKDPDADIAFAGLASELFDLAVRVAA